MTKYDRKFFFFCNIDYYNFPIFHSYLITHDLIVIHLIKKNIRKSLKLKILKMAKSFVICNQNTMKEGEIRCNVYLFKDIHDINNE